MFAADASVRRFAVNRRTHRPTHSWQGLAKDRWVYDCRNSSNRSCACPLQLCIV